MDEEIKAVTPEQVDAAVEVRPLQDVSAALQEVNSVLLNRGLDADGYCFFGVSAWRDDTIQMVANRLRQAGWDVFVDITVPRLEVSKPDA